MLCHIISIDKNNPLIQKLSQIFKNNNERDIAVKIDKWIYKNYDNLPIKLQDHFSNDFSI